jgi:hypothetical protein
MGWLLLRAVLSQNPHLTRGIAHAGLSHGKQAFDAFKAALIIDSELQLPGNPSPRILEWWSKAGGGAGGLVYPVALSALVLGAALLAVGALTLLL